MSQELWRVCVHECGHAVAFLALGQKVSRIVASDDGGGFCEAEDNSLSPLDNLLVYDAGIAAEFVLVGSASLCTSDHDGRMATAMIAASGVCGISPERRRQAAEQFVWRNMDAIAALAELLRARKTMTTGDIANACHASPALEQFAYLYPVAARKAALARSGPPIWRSVLTALSAGDTLSLSRRGGVDPLAAMGFEHMDGRPASTRSVLAAMGR
jgi:hypothetical protein